MSINLISRGSNDRLEYPYDAHKSVNHYLRNPRKFQTSALLSTSYTKIKAVNLAQIFGAAKSNFWTKPLAKFQPLIFTPF